MTKYTGINIQWPISSLILEGAKTVETRTYPIPKRLLNTKMLMIETPGKNGKFRSRIRAIIKFTRCFKYEDEVEFYKDTERHKVDRDSEWSWESQKGKWGWEVSVIKVFDDPIPLKKRTGIIYSNDISLEI